MLAVNLQLLFLYVLECEICIIVGIYHTMYIYYRAISGNSKGRKNIRNGLLPVAVL